MHTNVEYPIHSKENIHSYCYFIKNLLVVGKLAPQMLNSVIKVEETPVIFSIDIESEESGYNSETNPNIKESGLVY
jgi:hypothetical protein